ncbi:hypothetical protein SLOPH_822 [Spraguea lophii 42_110]|uniref:Prolyl 4-hydroxylase alpha subunit Fe(2+) 2OG dioxygenase domain-containing protein n=1 Tax=Spraguea lophii (strain 42_110) TaxID=1358809 RepID=S7W8W2_SPRLO|nr:hypothetical protein SLOPH_822 [Spraguea lophii 42_110]
MTTTSTENHHIKSTINKKNTSKPDTTTSTNNVNISHKPFFHFTVDNFLTEEEFNILNTFYNTLEFTNKKSDLFDIGQSNALQIEFLEKKLNRIFHRMYKDRDNGYRNIEDILNTYETEHKECEEIETKEGKKVETNHKEIKENEDKQIETKENESNNKNKINDKITNKRNCIDYSEPKDVNTWIDIFASYYNNGSYLLCHDDMVENRLYAFIIYLNTIDDDKEDGKESDNKEDDNKEDKNKNENNEIDNNKKNINTDNTTKNIITNKNKNPSGDLIIYENDCITENKRIHVIKNRIAVFEVSELSFHEVDYTLSERKALTGWYNFKKKIETEEKSIKKKVDYSKYNNDMKNNQYKEIEIEEEIEDILYVERDIAFKDNDDRKMSDDGDNNTNDNNINITTDTNHTTINNDITINNNTITTIDTTDINIINKYSINGPFINRRLLLLEGIFHKYNFKGLRLLDTKYYYLREGDYILLNDKINDIGYYEYLYNNNNDNNDDGNNSDINSNNNKDISNNITNNNKNNTKIFYDLFIVEDTIEVKVVGNEEIILEIDKGITLVNREDTQMYIDRVTKPYYLGHLIYVKE